MKPMPMKLINRRLADMPYWSRQAKAIHRIFEFDDFLASIDFVDRIAVKSQKVNHHPDIDIRYNKVKLTLTTHDDGGITAKDFSLARQFDESYSEIP
jgi:4a-hydroxytetrahydrobiopterin dehydratase